MKQQYYESGVNNADSRDCDDIQKFERRLRADAGLALHAPSPVLRGRTLESLTRDAIRPIAAMRFNRHRALALAACLVLSVTSFIVIVRWPSQVPPVPSPIATQASFNITFPRPREGSFENPLLNEAQLIARDAQRTMVRFKVGLPSPLRFNRDASDHGSAS